jgi:dihydrodipicolinate synthase/N-acetylneuraminate lyase
MKPLQSDQVAGTWATILLPIADDDGIDFARLNDETEYLLTTGIDGIYTNGTAGEFYSQTEEEFDRVQELVAEKCERAEVPFQIGASHTSPQITLSRARRAAQLKPGAIQVILPDWSPLSNAEAIAFLQRVAEAVAPIGLILYNPPHAKRLLQPPDYAEICAAVPQLIGIKVAGPEPWYAEIHQRVPRISMFVTGHQLASGCRVGASGSYSNVACLHPGGAKHWNELMKTDLEAALEIEARIQGFLDTHILPFRNREGYSNQALDKLLAAIGGWSNVGTRLRWPYKWLERSVAERLRPMAKGLISELFVA